MCRLHIQQAIADAMKTGKTHYPPSTGLPQLRAAMLKKMREENSLPIKDDEHVLVTIGGMHGLYMAFASLLEPGDEVILPDPMWSEIAELIKRPGGVPVPITLRADQRFSLRSGRHRSGDHAEDQGDLYQFAAEPDRRGVLRRDAAADRGHCGASTTCG